MWLPKHTESIGLKTRYLHSRRGHSVASVTESSCVPSSRWKKKDGHGALGGATHAPSMQNEAPPSPQISNPVVEKAPSCRAEPDEQLEFQGGELR